MELLTSNFTHYHEAYSYFACKEVKIIDKCVEQDFKTHFVDKLCQNIGDQSELHVLGVGSGNGKYRL